MSLTWAPLIYIYKTACLRRAGEALPDKIPSEENQEDKFTQLMKNKTVHLLAIFLMVYIGVEVTIGGMIRFTQIDCSNKKVHNCKRMDRNILDDRSWRWTILRLSFDWVLWW
jgi:hypothetical protein